MALRQALCRALERGLKARLAPLAQEDLRCPALVIAPHPDDETLGCGGLVCKMIDAGAQVHFVFVTDGAASHSLAEGPQALSLLRAREAVDAVRSLGADADHVTFLHIPDGKASDHLPRMTAKLADCLLRWKPETVLVVHGSDPPPDHRAVFLAARDAVRRYGQPVTIIEYPVWYWYHWPWIALERDLPGMWYRNLRQALRTIAGVRALWDMNLIVDVTDVAERKRAALDAHRTQTSRPEGRPDWPILADLGQGDFLRRLMRDYEVFRRYAANAPS